MSELPSLWHHVAVRVADLDAAVAFYRKAFGTRVRNPPFVRDGVLAGLISGDPRVRSLRMCHLAFAEGVVELVELPRGDDVPPPSANLLHVGVQVADVDAALAAVEDAGGRRLWAEPRRVGDTQARVVYAADPDGTVLELIELSMEDAIASVGR